MNKLKKLSLLALCVTGFNTANAQTEATFYTSMGSFTVDMTDTLTPVTVDSFISRITSKFYDGLIFHRVIKNFMIQGGDPNGNGTGGPGYKTNDEIVPSLKNAQKTLAMANSGPNTNGSQFYINLVDNHFLDGKYTVLGVVTNDFQVVQNIGVVPTAPGDKPVSDVKIDSIRITRFPAAVSTISNTGLDITISPNPSRGLFNITVPKGSKVEVLNMTGQVVFSKKGKGELKVDIQDQPKGMYIVRVSNSKGKSENKVIVQ